MPHKGELSKTSRVNLAVEWEVDRTKIDIRVVVTKALSKWASMGNTNSKWVVFSSLASMVRCMEARCQACLHLHLI